MLLREMVQDIAVPNAGWRERGSLRGWGGWLAFLADPVTWCDLTLLVQDIITFPAVLRGWGALLGLAGQLDVAPNHSLSLNAAVWLGGWHCVGEGPKRSHELVGAW